METLKLTSISIKEVAKIVAEHIDRSELIIIPVDTAYAVTVNALDEEAVKKVFILKKRKFENPIPICINNINKLNNYVYVSKIQKEILNHFLPGAITFILKKRKILSPILTGGLDTVGIRIPNTSFITMLSNYLNVPFTLTSANLSGMPTLYSIKDIINQFEKNYLKEYCSLVVETDKSLLGNPSTIVDITNEREPMIIREGVVNKNDVIEKIKEILKKY